MAMFLSSPAEVAPRTTHPVLGSRKLCVLTLALLETRS